MRRRPDEFVRLPIALRCDCDDEAPPPPPPPEPLEDENKLESKFDMSFDSGLLVEEVEFEFLERPKIWLKCSARPFALESCIEISWAF